MASLWFSLLLVLYVGFIGAASLILGTGELSWDKGITKLTDLRAAFSQGQRFHDLRDIATNILLYLPLGAIAATRLDPARIRLLSPWLACGTAVSVVMEFTQAFTDRTPDPIDLVTNTVGYVAGYALVFIAIKRFGLRPAMLLGLSAEDHGDERLKVAQALIFLYICIYSILQLVPFDISVSLGKIHGKLLAGESGVPRIILDPLFRIRQGPEGILPMVYALLGLIPVAALKSHINTVRGRDNVFGPIWFCTFVAAIIEICQVFVLSRTTDVTDVVLAPLGGVIGVVLARGWHWVQETQLAGRPGTEREAEFRPGGAAGRVHIIGLALLIYFIFLSFLAWAPYQFESDFQIVLQKLKNESNWWPFREHFAVRSVGSARDLVEETLQFIPLGLLTFILLTRVRPRATRRSRLVMVGVGCGAVATFLEFSQAFCTGRVVDVTDIVLGVAGGVIGGLLVRLFASRPGRPRSS